jgi:hypothetical protein
LRQKSHSRIQNERACEWRGGLPTQRRRRDALPGGRQERYFPPATTENRRPLKTREAPWAGALAAAHAAWLGWMAAAAAVLSAYVRAFGASLGTGQDFCGPLAKPQRMFFLTLGCLGAILDPRVLAWALWLVSMGAFITAGRRVVRLYRKLP